MYEATPDPYCYPDSDVLKNKAGIRDAAVLEAYEAAMTFARSEEPLPAGRFTPAHYRHLHHHLFQDVYAWAGQYRRVRIAKGTSAFCYPENIAAEMRRLFAWLQGEDKLRHRDASAFARGAAHFLGELNAIHAFREGNGRTQLTFLAMMADTAGHPLDFDRIDEAPTLSAMIASFHGDEAPLTSVIRTWME